MGGVSNCSNSELSIQVVSAVLGIYLMDSKDVS